MLNWIQVFLFQLWFPTRKTPVHDLHPKQKKSFIKQNWSFILLLALAIAFFVIVWVFQLGNDYPNELMGNL